jgi:hypothetical protein
MPSDVSTPARAIAAADARSPFAGPGRRSVRVAGLLAGLLACQFVVLGSSLWGATILLPLDILGERDAYLPPPAAGAAHPDAKDPLRSDLVYQMEPWRRFVVDEVRAGRVPLWNPYNYCGHPLLAANQPGVFSPYRLLDYAWPSPVAVAWGAVLRAVVGGVGAYLFFRRAMGAGWLPSAVGAWCFPLGGTLVLSGGYPGAAVVSFLPWVLLAADAVARRPGRRAVAGLAAAVACTLLAGHAAFAGHVLLAGGVYFLARLQATCWPGPGHLTSRDRQGAGQSNGPVLADDADASTAGPQGRSLDQTTSTARLPHGRGSLNAPPDTLREDVSPGGVLRSVMFRLSAGAVGVLFGCLLSAPQTLPTVDYLRSSYRIAKRQAGQVESPPSGPAGLIQMVLPFGFGSSERAADYVGLGPNWIESPAGGYAGLVVALALAPFAFADPARWRQALFWSAVAVLAVAPAVGIPGLDLLFRVPPVSLLRNNRLVFVAGFAVLSLGVLGLDLLCGRPGLAGRPAGRRAIAVGAALAAGVGATCVLRAADPTGVVPAAVPWEAVAGNPLVALWPAGWEQAAGGQPAGWFGLMYLNGTAWSALAAAALLAVGWWLRRHPAGAGGDGTPVARRLAVGLAAAAVVELTGWAAGVAVTTDPALYYPRLAWMDAVAAGRHGRVCGVGCLPANLTLVHRVPDVRGYDAADPTPTVELIRCAQTSDAAAAPPPDAAVAQTLTVDPAHPAPAARLLGVRYYVGRGDPPAGVTPAWRGPDYWVVEDAAALPRVTLPGGVRVVPAAADRLRELASPAHDAAGVALLEVPPPTDDQFGGGGGGGAAAAAGVALGSAVIVEDLPGRVRIDVYLSRGGLLRLADAWDAGWRATYDGRPVDVYRVDHALRGVFLPAGRAVVEFRYEPASFRWGIILAGVGAVVLGLLAVRKPSSNA